MNCIVFDSNVEDENNEQIICRFFTRKIFYQFKNFDNPSMKPDKFRLVFN